MEKKRVAIIAVLAVLVIWAFVRASRACSREKFVSKAAMDVFTTAKPLFDKTKGDASYSDYKMHVDHADPVQYSDLRRLWKEKKLTPEAVQANL